MGEKAFKAALIRVSEGSLDRRRLNKRHQLGPGAEAQDTFDQLKSMEYDPAWWELAFTTNDRLAGLVIPTQLPSAATIGYIGVAPEMRGKGYGEVLLIRGTTTLLKSGAPLVTWRYRRRQQAQLTEGEAVFRTLKSELNLRPIFHRLQRRVEAHILIAFLGYCLWICLKQKLRAAAGSLTPAQVIHSLKGIILVEVWFDLRKGGRICLPRITQPEAQHQLILHHLGWSLPEQPPRPEGLKKAAIPHNQQLTNFNC